MLRTLRSRAVLCQHVRALSTAPIRPATINVLGKDYPTDDYTNVTPTILSKLTANLHKQQGHPLHTLRSFIERTYPTFSSLSPDTPLVTTYQNFDSLSFSPDHPGRSASDSYYVNRDLLLRTHTSAHEVEVFARGEDRWLLFADVYRRDEIDASHYPAFHQTEGARIFSTDPSGIREIEEDNARMEAELAVANIIIEDIPHLSKANPHQPQHDPRHAALVAQNLKLSLNALMLNLFGGRTRLGADRGEPLRVRWIEAYFPFTSPSYEVEVFFGGDWLEILGCGVIQQATLDNAKVSNKLGWAFGLGLERIAMILYGIPDIRLFWSKDQRFLSQFKPGEISTFKPYSKYPACFKDVSFWVPQTGLHENDFCDLVRDVAGDLAEDVKMIDSFVHPKTNRESRCYRINYRSMDRSLANEEVNEVQQTVITQLKNIHGVEIR